MKTKLTIFILCMGILVFPGCNSEENDLNPCQKECLNGGEKISGIDACYCDCPEGFTGENCETTECPATVECPMGKTPNPAKDCVCE